MPLSRLFSEIGRTMYGSTAIVTCSNSTIVYFLKLPTPFTKYGYIIISTSKNTVLSEVVPYTGECFSNTRNYFRNINVAIFFCDARRKQREKYTFAHAHSCLHGIVSDNVSSSSALPHLPEPSALVKNEDESTSLSASEFVIFFNGFNSSSIVYISYLF